MLGTGLHTLDELVTEYAAYTRRHICLRPINPPSLGAGVSGIIG